MVKKKGVREKDGRSWIELHGAIHQFKAGDLSHPETEGIYKLLEGQICRAKMHVIVLVSFKLSSPEVVVGACVSQVARGNGFHQLPDEEDIEFLTLSTARGCVPTP
ncbi:unnamed protein product [Ilex paraguariensis]|uniref:Carbonic anhydrase n=1 Tax=Ilex paraguariensis TaxID=185542 RepID=A0ABC8RFH6_9AQUA